MNKPRIVKDYEKLSDKVVEQLKLVYPRGFVNHLVSYTNKDGEQKKGLPFETDDYYYLIRMTENKADLIIEEDDDYDDYGNLKPKVKKSYEDKYDNDEFLNELNANSDNDLGYDEEFENEYDD